MTARQDGFTIVELLVALLIFGMLAGAGVMLLRFSVDAQASAKTRLEALAASRRVESLLGADMAQAVPRATRNETGAVTPAFEGSPDRFSLVRGGWDNLDGAARPSLQRVEYRLAGGRLERVQWPMLDGAAPEAPAAIVERVATLRLRYRAADGWRDRWDAIRTDAVPRALELTVRQTDGPEYRYVFLVGAGA
jgi:general secretion pathway protein J